MSHNVMTKKEHTQEIVLLASASPRRSELLNQIKVRHLVIHVPAGPGEDEPRLPGEPPLDYVQRTANEKSERARRWILTAEGQEQLNALSGSISEESVFADHADQQPIILTADTTVCIGDDILGKPQDARDAWEILKRLSGTTHLVHTAVVVCRGSQHWSALSSTEVVFDALSDGEIERYIASGEPFGKAGAYGIQGIAAAYVKQIKGSYSGVMGLPLYETAQLLKRSFR
jgi:septum formation protein